MKEEIQEGVYQINAYELDAHETLKEGDLFIVQSAGSTSVLHKVTLGEIKTYIGGSEVPDSTITDARPITLSSGTGISFSPNANRTYGRLLMNGSLAAAITFTTNSDEQKRNEHYLLISNQNSSTASVGVSKGSYNELIGMSKAVEIPPGKSVEFSFKVYSDGSTRVLIVTHSDVL
mgnify:CR=1 FL=1